MFCACLGICLIKLLNSWKEVYTGAIDSRGSGGEFCLLNGFEDE
jgi:hypothetical protein